MNKDHIYIIMGVSGSGKSTVGKLLATKLNIPFFDGDDYHPKANVQKMANGCPLNDTDRKGWLQKLNELAIDHKNEGAVIACSALKEKYRTQLKQGLINQMVFVYLHGTFDQIYARLKARKDHYMPAKLLKSQFDTLEIPKNSIQISILKSPEDIVYQIMKMTQ
ncbi:MAG: gluconokinase [Maribacter sp.]|nr:gluconokinase [Maribacter sp.]